METHGISIEDVASTNEMIKIFQIESENSDNKVDNYSKIDVIPDITQDVKLRVQQKCNAETRSPISLKGTA